MKTLDIASGVASASSILASGVMLVIVPSVVLAPALVSSVMVTSAAAIEYQDLKYLQATGQCPQCNLQGAILSNASLMGAQLMEADLARAELSQASLMASNLVNANLNGANLSGANLSGADLSYADLSSANLINAVLWDVNWNGASTEGALYSEDTIFDDAVNPERLGMILVENGQRPLASKVYSDFLESTGDRSVR